MKRLWALCIFPFFVPGAARCQQAAHAKVQGVVRDARGGATLPDVQVTLENTSYRTTTDAQGRFEIDRVAAGEYKLRIAAAGYEPSLSPFSVAATEARDFDVALTPQDLSQTTSVQVTAGAFDGPGVESPSAMRLSGTDAKNLASVLVNDPLRSLQALPGVTSDNDFSSRLSLRAADSSRIGTYLDGIQLHQPYDMIDMEGGSVTVTAIDGEMLESADLQTGVFPSQYSDSTAAAVDLQTREGNQVQSRFRITAGAAYSGFEGEGPLGKDHAGDWIFTVRKSYLQYIIDHTSTDLAPYAFGIFDYQGRVAYNLNNANKVSLSVLDGYSDLDRTKDTATLGLNDLKKSNYHYTLANLGWNFTPNYRFLVSSHAAYMREAMSNENRENMNFDLGQYSEWVGNTNATWMWNSQNSLNFGWSMRQIRDDGLSRTFQYLTIGPTLALNNYRGTAVHLGGHGENVWKAARGRVRLTAGLRWDKYGVDDVQTLLPQATLALLPWQSTRISLGFGQYAQAPDPMWAFSSLGGRTLLPERANSFVIALEQRLSDRTRLRVEYYDREDRDLLFRSFFDPRLVDNRVFGIPYNPPMSNALRGYARGMQVFLQRHSSGRLTGWVSYSLGFSRLQDSAAAILFPSDDEQRHTINAYVGYRLRPSVNFTVRSSYGSGMPISGFFAFRGGSYYLSGARNALYNHPYSRTDVRVSKEWNFDRWKLTLFGEALNAFDRANALYENLNGYNPVTGQASLEFMSMLPVVPSAGLMTEF